MPLKAVSFHMHACTTNFYYFDSLTAHIANEGDGIGWGHLLEGSHCQGAYQWCSRV